MEVFLPDFLNTLFGWILSLLGRSKIKAEHQTHYEELRYKTAEALTMYANCLSNPINIEVSCLPDSYKEGSNELRRIASGFDALSKVLPKNAKGIPVNKEQLKDVSRYLIGLSNSFSYVPIESHTRRKEVREWEQEVRTILDIQD